MKKFIITEEERKHIMGLYEENVNNLPELGPERLRSPKSQQIKKEQEFFNKKYPEFKIPVDGNWLDKSFNDAMVKYITEKGGTPMYCKTGDNYCPEDEDGVVYTTDSKIRYELQQEMKGGDKQEPNSDDWMNIPQDTVWEYKNKDGKWFGRKMGDPSKKEYDVTKYPTTVKRLNDYKSSLDTANKIENEKG